MKRMPDPISEGVPEAQLNLPRRLVAVGVRRENGAIVCRRAKEVARCSTGRQLEVMVWIVEVGVVQQIEKFAAKLHALALGTEREALGEREIEIGNRAGR